MATLQDDHLGDRLNKAMVTGQAENRKPTVRMFQTYWENQPDPE